MQAQNLEGTGKMGDRRGWSAVRQGALGKKWRGQAEGSIEGCVSTFWGGRQLAGLLWNQGPVLWGGRLDLAWGGLSSIQQQV